MTRRIGLVGSVLVLCLLALPHLAFAQATPAATVDQVLADFQAKTQAMQGTISSYANTLFFALAFFEFAATGIFLVLRNADMGEWVVEIVKLIFFIGFYLALLENGFTWTNDIIQSFQDVGNAAATGVGASGALSPGQVLMDAVQIVQTMWHNTHWDTPGYDFEVVLVGIVTLVVLAIVAAYMVEALVESFFVITAGMLLLGFGASRWTKEYAVKVVMYCVSVGAKLFLLQLIIAVGMQFVTQYVNNPPSDAAGFCTMIGVLILLLAVALMIPAKVQALLMGVTASGSGALTAAAGLAGGAIAGAVSGGLSSGMAGWEAMRLGAKETGEGLGSSSGGGAGRIGRALQMAGGTVGRAGYHLGGAGLADMRNKLEGDPSTRSGSRPGRMARMIRSKRVEPPPSPPPVSSS